jgi:hypothetical protein
MVVRGAGVHVRNVEVGRIAFIASRLGLRVWNRK